MSPRTRRWARRLADGAIVAAGVPAMAVFLVADAWVEWHQRRAAERAWRRLQDNTRTVSAIARMPRTRTSAPAGLWSAVTRGPRHDMTTIPHRHGVTTSPHVMTSPWSPLTRTAEQSATPNRNPAATGGAPA